ncbi:hydroxyethylthiazole kinase [Spirochaeta cellobiosiphila]|uniref:hydroxyethylthiazole kinase n=1 Tax=Spirochaeta cellobiosiphila TaxID=504483 RepID=UPI00042550EB|nr:hydroxyethylthiazole kinase [Spirochaeta cellobiosiphila]
MEKHPYQELHKKNPRVYVLTNDVTRKFIADALLAIGAKPIMGIAPEEAFELTSYSDALCLNLGTPTKEKFKSYIKALKSGMKNNIPTSIDIPGASASHYRKDISTQIIKQIPNLTNNQEWPRVIHGNPSEIISLSGNEVVSQIDSIHTVQEASLHTNNLKDIFHSIVITGPQTLIKGDSTTLIPGGSPYMSYCSGFGCVQTALMAAFLTLPIQATEACILAAQLMFCAAKQIKAPNGPRDFQNKFIDHLFQITYKEHL